jgi:hypothetical protein
MAFLKEPTGTTDEQITEHLRRMSGPVTSEGTLQDTLQFIALKIAELRQATTLLLELERERRKFPSRIPGGWN